MSDNEITAGQEPPAPESAAPAETVRELEQAWNADPETEFARLVTQGTEQLRAGRLFEARSLLEQARILRPDDDQLLNLLGLTQFKSGELEQAAQTFLRILQRFPDEPTLLLNLSLVYLRQEDFTQAEQGLQRLLNANPDHQRAAAYLRMVQEQRQQQTSVAKSPQPQDVVDHPQQLPPSQQPTEEPSETAAPQTTAQETAPVPELPADALVPVETGDDDKSKMTGDAPAQSARKNPTELAQHSAAHENKPEAEPRDLETELLAEDPAEEQAIAIDEDFSQDGEAQAAQKDSLVPAEVIPEATEAAPVETSTVSSHSIARSSVATEPISHINDVAPTDDDKPAAEDKQTSEDSIPAPDAQAFAQTHEANPTPAVSAPSSAAQLLPSLHDTQDPNQNPILDLGQVEPLDDQAATSVLDGLVQIRLVDQALLRQDRWVGRFGDLHSRPAMRRQRGVITDRPLGGEHPLVEVHGQGTALLRLDEPTTVTAHLDEEIFVIESRLLALIGSARHEIAHIDIGLRKTLPLLRLRGSARLVLVSDRRPARLRIHPTQPATVLASSLLAFVGKILPRLATQEQQTGNDLPMLTLLGEGEAWVDGGSLRAFEDKL